MHEMTAAASSHQRMADVIGRLVGQMASRGADEDKREAGRYRVEEMNAGGLESARSEVVVKRCARQGRGEDARGSVESEDGSAGRLASLCVVFLVVVVASYSSRSSLVRLVVRPFVRSLVSSVLRCIPQPTHERRFLRLAVERNERHQQQQSERRP